MDGARDRPSAIFGSLAPGVPGPEHAQECCACTRDLFVYTQEILLCIHNKCILILSYHIIILYYMIILL